MEKRKKKEREERKRREKEDELRRRDERAREILLSTAQGLKPRGFEGVDHFSRYAVVDHVEKAGVRAGSSERFDLVRVV